MSGVPRGREDGWRVQRDHVQVPPACERLLLLLRPLQTPVSERRVVLPAVPAPQRQIRNLLPGIAWSLGAADYQTGEGLSDVI